MCARYIKNVPHKCSVQLPDYANKMGGSGLWSLDCNCAFRLGEVAEDWTVTKNRASQ